MSIELMCPACGSVNGFSQQQAGQKGKCGQCDTPIYVPLPEEMRQARLLRGRSSNRTILIGAIAAASLFVACLLAVGLYFLVDAATKTETKVKEDDKKIVQQPKDFFSSAALVKLEANVPSAQESKIEQPKGEFMVKIKAPTTCTLAVQFDSGDKLDGRLFVYDAAKKEIAQNDADADKRISQIFVPVQANQEYYVKASCADDKAIGSFKLTLTPITDVGNDFDRALEVRLSRKGAASSSWKIEPVGDADYFRFTAPFDGTLIVEQKATGPSWLDSTLFVYDSTRRFLKDSTSNNVAAPRIIRISVQSGKTYYVMVEAYKDAKLENKTGTYTLSFRMEKDTAEKGADPFATAREVFLDNFGFAKVFGSINLAKDLQYFKVKAKNTGKMTVHLNYPQGSNLDGFMVAYNANKQDVGFNQFSLSLQVIAGSTYYVKVGSQAVPAAGLQRTGNFDLSFSETRDNFNPPQAEKFNTAQVVAVHQGFGSAVGQVKNLQDASYYKVQPDTSGLMVFLMKPNPGIFLRFQVYDSFKLPVGQDNPEVKELVVSAGSTYYVRVYPDVFFTGKNVGGFQFSVATEKIAPDDFGNDFATAHEVVLPEAGDKVVTGRIEIPNDVDFFRFKAPETGWMFVQCVPAPFSKLDQKLNCYDDTRFEVGHPYFPVEKGQTYYAKVSSWSIPLQNRRSTGHYNLTMRFEKNLIDDYGNDFDSASPIKLLVGLNFRSGRIEIPEDVDFFRFEATTTGTMSVKLMRQTGSQFNGHLFVYDKDKNLIKDTDKDAGNFMAFVRQAFIPVKLGQTYYVKVAPAKGALKHQLRGFYTLELDTAPPKNKLGGGGALILNVQGNLAATDPIDKVRAGCYAKVYSVKMSQGKLYTIDMESNVVDSYLRLEDGLGKQLAFDDDSGGGLNARIVFEPSSSGNYNVIATSFSANQTGLFSLQVREK